MADPLQKIKAIPQALVTGLTSSLAAKAATTVTDALDTRLDTAESNIATLNGLAINYPGGANVKLDGEGDFSVTTDAQLSTSDVTTNDVTTAKHGFVPKAPNSTSQFLRGDASWAVPSLKLYIKDAAGTPHYWQLTISTLGVLTTTDAGTTLPTDGIVVIP